MCDVCCEPFNLSNHKRVNCQYCSFAQCASCAERYILDSHEDPHCMNCRKGWNREVLCNAFTIKFVSKTLKARREELLFDRERSLMPATQPWVEAETQKRKYEELSDRARNAIGILWAEYHRLVNTPVQMDDIQGLIERSRSGFEIQKNISGVGCDLKHYAHCQGLLSAPISSHASRRQFVRACPRSECKGFLSTAWKCGLCEYWACPTCHEVKGLDKDAPHTCNPDNVATAAMLARDSRNCPKCASLIFKIDGCDQMFCTQCHTAFSWRTGRVESGRIHNPHYYDYMRVNGVLPREPGDEPCGGLPSMDIIYRTARHTLIPIIHRMYGHIQHVVIGRYRTDFVEDNRDIRIKFMLSDFTDDVFKRKLQQREKARQKKTDIRQVLEMYQTVTVDLFQSLLTHKNVDKFLEELSILRDHVNDVLGVISKRYTNCSVPRISQDFKLY